MRNPHSPGGETLLHWWGATSAGIEVRSVSAAEIEEFERRCGLTLPVSFQAYLRVASPVEEASWDNELTNWWPFGDLCSVAEGYEHELAHGIANYREKLLLFADWSIWCWAWALNCAAGPDHGKVAVIGGENDHFVAESFDDFIERYIKDDPSICP